MKEDTILNVLLYLFKHYANDNDRLNQINESLMDELTQAGFGEFIIHQAIKWIKALQGELLQTPDTASTHAYRVYSDYERSQLDDQCLSFIYYLESEEILDQTTREVILHQLIALEDEQIDVSLIKWVTLMVLYSMPERQPALKKMQFLVLDHSVGGVH